MTGLSSPASWRGQGAAIIPLSEGAFTIDETKLFVPFDDQRDNLQERSKGSLLVEVQPFVVITSKDILLLDTGLGFNADGELQIHKNLKDAGLKPEQITKVLLSHLHKDHAGGVSKPIPTSPYTEGVANFPNAVYYLQKRELDFAFEKNFPSFIVEDLLMLNTSLKVKFLNDDEGVIDDYISYKVTAAHSPFHQVFWIKENNNTIFFGGDDAPQLQQMKMRYKTKYDFNPDKAMQLRQQWWQKGNEENWKFLFYHDIKTPVYGPLSPGGGT